MAFAAAWVRGTALEMEDAIQGILADWEGDCEL